MEGAFHRLVYRLASDGEESIDSETEVSPALEQWYRECRSAAVKSMEQTFSAAGNSSRAVQAVAEADISFRGQIRAVFPMRTARKGA